MNCFAVFLLSKDIKEDIVNKEISTEELLWATIPMLDDPFDANSGWPALRGAP